MTAEKKRPTLSVILPHYNHEKLLPRALDSYLNQSVQADEILVMDDCSTDGSIAIIEEYARKYPSVRLYQAPKNVGNIVNGNLGLEMVEGDFIYWAASDDFVHPGFFEKSLDLLAEHPDARISCTVGDWRDEKSGLITHIGTKMGDRPSYLSPVDVEELEKAGRLQIPSNTILWHRQTLLELGGLDSELKWHCDWFLYTMMALRYGVCFVPEALAVFFMHPAGLSARTPEKEAAHQVVLKNILEALESERFADLKRPICDSGALYIFGSPMRRLISGDRRFREYLTPLYLRKSRWHSFKTWLKPLMPRWISELILRMIGAKSG